MDVEFHRNVFECTLCSYIYTYVFEGLNHVTKSTDMTSVIYIKIYNMHKKGHFFRMRSPHSSIIICLNTE